MLFVNYFIVFCVVCELFYCFFLLFVTKFYFFMLFANSFIVIYVVCEQFFCFLCCFLKVLKCLLCCFVKGC